MKAIIYIKEVDKNGKLDLNTCSIFSGNMENNKRLSHLTDKGYYSKKPLYINFATLERVKTLPNGNKYIDLSNAEYDYLEANFTQKGKIFQTYEEKKRTEKAIGDLAWCSLINDPYDVG